MKLRLNKMHYPVTVLGPGRRIGLWMQGCTIGCAGCMSRDTWDRREETAVEVTDVATWCLDQAETGADGITISGGEPFEQPEALRELLQLIAEWRRLSNRTFDILCYSGMKQSRLQRDFGQILDLVDALIPEPFQQRRPGTGKWRGSANQPLVALTELGRRLYSQEAPTAEAPLVQVGLSDGRLLYIGIPQRGDIARLEIALGLRGVTMKDVSWRA